jgi:uncharacterized protein YcfJ
MKNFKTAVFGVSAILALQACASTPMGPTVRVMPPPGKPFEQFQADDVACRGFASQQVSGEADAANNKAVGAAVVGAALGAALGGAGGGGRGAATGAAAGGIVGTAVGTSGSEHTQRSIQEQYNIAYEQCMQSHGDQVPQPVVIRTIPAYAPPPAVIYAPPPPPPPPGYSPPPGAGYAPPPGAGYAPPGQ